MKDKVDMYDVCIIGGGPAGSTAAKLLASQGVSVLVIEKSKFPRDKVCGGCIPREACDLMSEIFPDAPLQSKLKRLDSLKVVIGKSLYCVPIKGGAAIDRSLLDEALLGGAQRSGAGVLFETVASLLDVTEEEVTISLRSPAHTRIIKTKIVVNASGLQGVKHPNQISPVVDKRSYIGFGTKVFLDNFESGSVIFSVAPAGYMGCVGLSGGQVDLAAAVSAESVKSLGISTIAQELSAQVSIPLLCDKLKGALWKTTSFMTRRNELSAKRYFSVGDAARYVEPFTGEGIYSAIKGAVHLVPIILQSLRAWSPDLSHEWETVYEREVGPSLKSAELVRKILRLPSLIKHPIFQAAENSFVRRSLSQLLPSYSLPWI